MACTQCTDQLELNNLKANIYWMSEIAELSAKSKLFLSDLGYECSNAHGIDYIEVSNNEAFFEAHLDLLQNTFNTLERKKIKLFIDTTLDSFSFESIIRSKSLQRYINLIEDREFFHIVKEKKIASHFQAIVNAADKTLYGYEVLSRGVKEDGSLMFPDQFFEKSARNDMNFQVDKLCREMAMKNAAAKKIDLKIFINFIPTSIYDPAFCLKSTVAWANELGFKSENIVFEVVETEAVNDQEHLKKILLFYRKQGFKIALDDVGEGFSNLNILIKIQPDIIKIDRNIIQDINKYPLKQSVYKALYTLAKENAIKVLAEGVETEEELNIIQSIGVDYIQGYYFDKPHEEPTKIINAR